MESAFSTMRSFARTVGVVKLTHAVRVRDTPPLEDSGRETGM